MKLIFKKPQFGSIPVEGENVRKSVFLHDSQ